MSTVKYRIYCITENIWVESFGVVEPTVCSNNPAHTVNTNSVQIINTKDITIGTSISNISTNLTNIGITNTNLGTTNVNYGTSISNLSGSITNNFIATGTSTTNLSTFNTAIGTSTSNLSSIETSRWITIGTSATSLSSNIVNLTVSSNNLSSIETSRWITIGTSSVNLSNSIVNLNVTSVSYGTTLSNLGTTAINLNTSYTQNNINIGVSFVNVINDYGLKFAVIGQQPVPGTQGGTFTSGAWQTRKVDYIDQDPYNLIVRLTSNQFTLGPGSYAIFGSAPAYRVGNHIARIFNVTTNANEQTGTSEVAGNITGGSQTRSFFSATTTITTNTTYRIEHWCQTNRTTDGFGVANGFGTVENYTDITIRTTR